LKIVVVFIVDINKMTYSIVIPIAKYMRLYTNEYKKIKPHKEEHSNFRRFFEISWKLHCYNLDFKEIDTIFIVLPTHQIDEFKEEFYKLPQPKTKIEIIDEYDILGIPSYKVGNTRKQMLIKLLISFRVKTKTYLTLDDDIGTLNKFKEEFFYNDDDTIGFFMNSHRSGHEKWWVGSSYMLGLAYQPAKLDKLTDKGLLMDVTPELLHTKSVRNLCNFLKRKWGSSSWINELILKNVEYRWTEYTLYCLYLGLIKKNITKLYKRKTLPINNALWDFSNDSKVMTNHIKNKVCKDNKSYFVTIPSNIYANKLSAIHKGFKHCYNIINN